MTAIRICGMENFTSATQSPRLALFSVTARFLLSPVLQTINSFCIKEWFNSLPNKKKYKTGSKLKAFAEDSLNLVQMMISVFFFDRIENILGKGENAGDQHFLLFPESFQKAAFFGPWKPGIVWGKV